MIPSLNCMTSLVKLILASVKQSLEHLPCQSQDERKRGGCRTRAHLLMAPYPTRNKYLTHSPPRPGHRKNWPPARSSPPDESSEEGDCSGGQARSLPRALGEKRGLQIIKTRVWPHVERQAHNTGFKGGGSPRCLFPFMPGLCM